MSLVLLLISLCVCAVMRLNNMSHGPNELSTEVCRQALRLKPLHMPRKRIAKESEPLQSQSKRESIRERAVSFSFN